MPRKPQKRNDWLILESEFTTGDWETLESFFKEKGIVHNTWIHHTKGWIRARNDFRIQKIQLANEKVLRHKAERLARSTRTARVIGVRATRALLRRDLTDPKVISAKDLAEVTTDMIKLEQELTEGEQLTRIPGGLAVGVQIQETVDGRTISVMAKALGDAKASVRAVGQPALDDGTHQDSR